MKFTYEKEYDNIFDELVDRGYYEQATNEEENAGKRKENDNSKTEKTAVSEKGEKRSDKENC